MCLPGGVMLSHMARCPRRYARGPWQYAGTQGYTSSGLGCSLVPARYNCPPEIVVATLSRLSGR